MGRLRGLASLTATRTGLLAALAATAMIPLLVVAAVSIRQQGNVAVEETYTRLEGLASAQVNNLEALIASDRELAEFLAGSPRVEAAGLAWTNGTGEPGAALRDFLNQMLLSSSRLAAISLYDLDGDLIATTNAAAPGRYRASGVRGDQPYLSLVIEGATGKATAVTTSPISGIDGTALGTVLVETDASSVTELATNYDGQNLTGETSVAQATPDGAQFIAPLRFREGAVLNVVVPYSRTDAPITLAMAGNETRLGSTVDYRGEPVFAVTRHIEETGWGVVVKIDRAEALGGVSDFQSTMRIALAAAFAMVLALSLFISRSIWKPIAEIIATVSAVAAGDRSRRTPAQSPGDLAVLAEATNTMTDDLVDSADAAAARRGEVEELNRLLTVQQMELKAIFDNALDAILTVSGDGRIRQLNRAGQDMFGVGEESLGKLDAGSVLLFDDAPQRVFDGVVVEGNTFDWAAAAGATGVAMVAVRSDGECVPVHVTVSAYDDASRGYVALIRDISDRVAFERQLSHQATHDALTGLPNRASLQVRLGETLARVGDEAVALLFIDLDRFKIVNDSRGHVVGDKLLVEIARRLTSTVRSKDVVARFGGDEFVVVLSDRLVIREAERLADRIHAVLAAPFDLDGERVDMACSIGIAMSDAPCDPDALISNADLAMYRAKATGRDQTALFDQEMRVGIESRHQMEGALRCAIEAGEMEVEYQPIVNLHTGAVAGVETLSRWVRPGHGRVHPNEFIAVAEETGLIFELGRRVLRAACEEQAEWMRRHPDTDLGFTVNVSAAELNKPGWFEGVRDILEASGARPQSITIELTETALSADIEVAAARLAELKSLGVSIAIDDFGTGYSSLTYLRHLPIDTVKIDRSFMHELQTESPDSTIVALVLDLGRNLDINIVAEGVENAEQVEVLRRLNCDHAQGFYFASPSPAPDLDELVFGSNAGPQRVTGTALSPLA